MTILSYRGTKIQQLNMQTPTSSKSPAALPCGCQPGSLRCDAARELWWNYEMTFERSTIGQATVSEVSDAFRALLDHF